MFSTLRNRFGIPGVISVIALVFAMFGGAYAASNSSGGGKATASAKAKKGPRGKTGPAGPAGPVGPAGPAGAKGDAGAAGSNGTPGTPGANGASVTSSVAPPEPAHCEEGGSKFVVGTTTTYACNGTNGAEGSPGPAGDPWTAGGTLPVGSTETGGWSIPSLTESAFAFAGATAFPIETTISFAIPLANEVPEANVHLEPIGYTGAPGEDCPGSAKEPAAKSGHLCVYTGFETVVPGYEEAARPITALDLSAGQIRPAKGASRAGAALTFIVQKPELILRGSWAVTG